MNLLGQSAVNRAQNTEAEGLVGAYLETAGLRKVHEFAIAAEQKPPGAPAGAAPAGMPVK